MPTSDDRLAEAFSEAYTAILQRTPASPDLEELTAATLAPSKPPSRHPWRRGVLIAAGVAAAVLLAVLLPTLLSSDRPVADSPGHCAPGASGLDYATEPFEVDWVRLQGDLSSLPYGDIECDPEGGYSVYDLEAGGVWRSDDGLAWVFAPSVRRHDWVSADGQWAFSRTTMGPVGQLFRLEQGEWVQASPPTEPGGAGEEWSWMGIPVQSRATLLVGGGWSPDLESLFTQTGQMWRSVDGGPFERAGDYNSLHNTFPTGNGTFVRFGEQEASYRFETSLDGIVWIDGGIPEFWKATESIDAHFDMDDSRLVVTVEDATGRRRIWTSVNGAAWTEEASYRLPAASLGSDYDVTVDETALVTVAMLLDSPNPDLGFSNYQATFWLSSDSGRTWSEPVSPPDIITDHEAHLIGAAGDLLFVGGSSRSGRILWVGTLSAP